MKKIIVSLLISLSLLITVDVDAKSKAKKITCANEVNVYIFHGDGCPHCAEALEFFESIEESYGQCFNLIKYEVWGDSNNAAIMQAVGSYFGEEVKGVPYIVIGDKTYSGYAESYADDIKSTIVSASNNDDFVDVVQQVIAGGVAADYANDKDDDSTAGTIATILILVIGIGGLVALIITNKNDKKD